MVTLRARELPTGEVATDWPFDFVVRSGRTGRGVWGYFMAVTAGIGFGGE